MAFGFERSRCALCIGIALISLAGMVAASTGAETSGKPAVSAAADAKVAPTPPLPSYFNADSTSPDPTGAAAGVLAAPAGDRKGDIPTNLTSSDLFDRITHNMFSINMMWVLLAGCLVMFMHTGFTMVETGLCRAKNAAHTSAMNFMVYPLGCLAFWAYGFALGWGNWTNGPVPEGWYSTLGPGTALLNHGLGIGARDGGAFTYGLLGTKGFFLNGLDDVSIMAMFFYMMVFMDTAATIPTGAMAERWRWKNFCLFALWVALPYCIYANWVWGGGWLAQAGKNWGLGHGAVDFAGSGVVHGMGGIIAFVGAVLLGPRLGKFNKGRPMPLPGHHVPMVIVGTFILAFGWFGFNGGSTMAGTDMRIATVIVNTMLASVAGAITAMLTLWAKKMKSDPTIMCNGMLAGLVAITAPCAFVDSWAAVLIGAIAGVLVVLGVFFWERVGVDDPVGAISVHGMNGLWGIISLGIFANGKYGAGWNGVVRDTFVKRYGSDGVRGLLFGDTSQFFMQLLDAGVLLVFGLAMAFVLFKLSSLIVPLRVSREVEIMGLDGPEMGTLGYPDFTVANRS